MQRYLKWTRFLRASGGRIRIRNTLWKFFAGNLFSALLSYFHVLVFTRRHASVICQPRDIFSNMFHAFGSTSVPFPSPFMRDIKLMYLVCSRTSSHHHTESASKTLPPLVFARGPSSRKLKFLDFSPNKTRVIVDISGALPITQGSFSSMSVSSEGKLEP
jgi:hypothetical protein